MSVFRPPGYLRHQHLQSVLASASWRGALIQYRQREILCRRREVLVDAGDGVRLSAVLTPVNEPDAPWVVLLHGWEGSVDSTYLLDATVGLCRAGFAVARLNLRDHGGSYHLNPGLFHSCRLDEVVRGIGRLTSDLGARRFYLAGFSLGGNFALRVGLRADQNNLDIAHIVAVCPVVNPANTLSAIEQAPWPYQSYFLHRWRQSLKRKQACFPDRYQFGPWLERADLRGLTAELIQRYTEFASLADYLDGYSIAGDRLSALAASATIIAAADDPIIPHSDITALSRPDCLRLELQQRGGHCGFVQNVRLNSWITARLVAEFSHPQGRHQGAMAGSDPATSQRG